MERRVTTTVRMPSDLYEEVKRIAQEEERPLNTQLVRFIRWGIERHRAEHPERRESDRPE